MNIGSGLRSMDETGLPQDMRIRLGHALVEHAARVHEVRLLHIKGYSVEPGLYSGGRSSSDIDVLVHPSDVETLLGGLQSRGWNAATGFKSGSLFQHAATLWHDSWGYIDVHRAFPGVGVAPSEFFDELWRCRTTRPVAQVDCTVPARHHQALLIVLHAGRDPHRGASDVSHLREALPAEAWRRLQSDADRFGAGLAFAAATGRLAEYEDHPEHDVWAAVSGGSTRMGLLRARVRAAASVSGKIRVLTSALVPNRDHLRMALQREPRFADYLRELLGRVEELWSGIGTALRKRQRP